MSSADVVDENGLVGVGVSFNKIRRITGYLVGDVRKRFNNAKQAEVKDRVKHFKMQPTVNMGTEIHNSDKPASREYAVAAGA